MQVLEFKEFGGPSQLKPTERPLPQAADAHTAVVRIEAASVNPSDVKNVAGRMEQTTLPRVPGRDYSGVVVDGPLEWMYKEVWGHGWRRRIHPRRLACGVHSGPGCEPRS
jgi:NADPH2:quinone reductase